MFSRKSEKDVDDSNVVYGDIGTETKRDPIVYVPKVTIVFVGVSGVGKSTMIRKFVDRKSGKVTYGVIFLRYYMI